MAAISNGRVLARARRKSFAFVTTRRLAKTAQSKSQYCVNLVRTLDHENYLCTLLLLKSCRMSVFSVRAFNVELARVQDAVSDKNIGKMRLQFWRDALDQIYKGNPPQQPVALQLAEAVEKHKFTRRWLSRLIDGREGSLDNRPYETANTLEEYGENTVSSVLYLTLECLGVKDVHADHTASHLGKAIGIVTLLRSTPFHGSKGKVFLPNDVMIKHGVSHEDVIRGNTAQSVKDVTFELASLANTHLSTAKSLMSKAPKAASRAFLPMVSCQAYLTKIQTADFDLFHRSLRERNHLLPLLLLKHAWLGF